MDGVHRRWARLVCVPLALGLVVAACGDDDDDDDASDGTEVTADTGSDTTAATTGDTTGDTGAVGDVATITMVDYGYDLDPAALATGEFTVDLVNEGTEYHEAVVVQIPEDVDLGEVADVLASTEDPTQAPEGYGLIGFIGFAAPGETVAAAVPGEPSTDPEAPPVITEPLAAGRYAIVCFIPVGTTSLESEPTGGPHVLEGMITEFTVS
jgi:hypothetical protein